MNINGLQFVTRNIKNVITKLIIGIYTTKRARDDIRRKTACSRRYLPTIFIHNHAKFHLLNIITGFITTLRILIMFRINMKCPVFKTMTRAHILTINSRIYLYLN
jgi:hypothetical protein